MLWMIAALLVLLAGVYGFLIAGPWSFRAEFDRDVATGLSRRVVMPVVTESDVAGLPEPVRQYLRLTGVIGRPRVHNYRLRNDVIMRDQTAMRFRSILCPVDFSTHSRDALQHAVATAHRFGGRVTAMFVNDPLLLAAASGSSAGRQQFVERTRIELARFVNRAIASVPPIEDEIGPVVATGNVPDEILRTARRLRSDLIVIGTQGLSGFPKLFFGSTTEQVLRRATIPVLAIPSSKGTRRQRTHAMAVRRVVAPLDLAGAWQSDAIRAANVAAAMDAELVLVHVLAQIQMPPWLRSGIGATSGRRMATARRALERVKAKLSSDLTITIRVLNGSPAHEIARLTTGLPCLVVMSLRGGAGVWGARRGSIAYHVLTHSSTPVLALPRRRLGGRFSTRLSKAVTGALTERDRAEIAGIDAVLSIASTRKRAPS